MNRRFLALFGSVLLLAAMLPATVAAAAPSAPDSQFTEGGNFIVQMDDLPVVAYTGGVKGLKATAPKAGQKIDPQSGTVVAYVDYLKTTHDKVLAKTGGKKLYDYVYSYNGFAAKMTAAQANAAAKTAGVVAVSPQEIVKADTSSTPTFLGLDAKGGLWDQLGGVGSAGDGVIIGIIDTGIWPESLSFADRVLNGVPSFAPTAKLAFQQIPGWHGKCTPGEEFTAADCNQKLIGAQWFNAGFGGDAGVDAAMPWEFNSARDFGGHGSHTASTAGGNNGVPTTGAAAVFGTISGMAPHARIAMYKALWEVSPGQGSGTTTDLVAAIDQAVADGVDVINYSISGTLTNFADPVEISFLFAARAGIFVAESAGNSGPTTSTVAHPSPWTTTVAAGTHNRNGLGSVTLGNGATYQGASVATAVGPAPLIDSVDAGLPGADPTELALCYGAADGAAVLDPAKVAGKIVICQRGVTARVNKSLAVMEAGGVGMVLFNSPDSSLNADFHFVPTVHVDLASGTAIKAYSATAGATASIAKADIVYDVPAPLVASFSSRGPLLAGGGDLLKPDVIAPGQDILAAVAPPGNSGRDFDLYSGTSMSSPHVAGLAALLKDLHPSWSPMMIKSALMTTGYDLVSNAPQSNAEVATEPAARMIFRQGAGHVKPNSAVDPGLVFNAGWNDWLAFLCGNSSAVGATTCNALKGMNYSFDASDYNGASIAIGNLAGSQTVSRKVTNVGDAKATYSVSYTGMAGFDVSVDPPSFTLKPGESQKLAVTITRTSATLNAYTGGQMTWSDGTHNVRIPLVVKPVALAAPAQVSGMGDPISYPVTFGYDGTFTATARGLEPAVITADTVADDPTDSTCSLASPNAKLVPVAIAAGTTYARFSLFDADVNAGSDLDLCVFRGTTLVGSSGSGTSAEEVNLLNPAAADYTVVVQGWGVSGTTPFKLHTWLLGTADAGNMVVAAPATAVTGQSGTIGLTFNGLAAGTKYLGSVAYGGTTGMPSPTIVRVDMP